VKAGARRPGPLWATLTGLAAAAMVTAACGSSPNVRSGAPPLLVATGLYPLAQAVVQIGQGRARADDVVPDGADPRSYKPEPSTSASFSAAGLVVLGPAGFQPALDAAVASSGRPAIHVTAPAAGTYFWVDPAAMRDAVAQIADAMEKADPRDAATFRDGATAFEEALKSTDIDYQSTLATCPRRDVFAPDVAFAQTVSAYGLVFHEVGSVDLPERAAVATAAAEITATGTTTVFAEPWVSNTTLRAAAAASGVKVRTLDTLIGAPVDGWPAEASYLNLLEANLGALSSALGCPDLGSGA
jgi:zinc transport system substrate-binding protein